MYSAYTFNTDGSLSNRENLAKSELDAWMLSQYGKRATIKVYDDLTGNAVIFTDDGDKFVVSQKIKGK